MSTHGAARSSPASSTTPPSSRRAAPRCPTRVAAHRRAPRRLVRRLVGPLLVPASSLGRADRLLGPGEGRSTSASIGDGRLDRPAVARAAADRRRAASRQVEAAVAKRGEDPQPGLAELLRAATREPGRRRVRRGAADLGPARRAGPLAAARARRRAGSRPKFRTGGLAAELFPTPVELAAVICACRDRGPAVQAHRRACTTRCGTPTRRPGSPTTASSTCWPPPLAAADGAEVADGRRAARRHRPGAADRAGPRPGWTSRARCGSASARAACWSR